MEVFYDTNRLTFTTNQFQCYDVVLTNGVNTLTLAATDLAGNPTTTNFSVTLDYAGDNTPPVFSVVWPPDGTTISGREFTLQGRVDDATASIMAVIVDASGNTNPVPGVVQRDGLVWVNHLPLAAGANTLTLTATDAAGNATTNQLTLYQNNVLVTLDPLPEDQFNQALVSVSGTVSDASATVTVNGVTTTINSDGTWTANNVPVSPAGLAMFNLAVSGGSQPQMMAAANSGPTLLASALAAGSPSPQSIPCPQRPRLVSASYNGNYGIQWNQGYTAIQWHDTGSLIEFIQWIFHSYTWRANWTYASGGSWAAVDYTGDIGPYEEPVWFGYYGVDHLTYYLPPRTWPSSGVIPSHTDAYLGYWDHGFDSNGGAEARVMIEAAQNPAAVAAGQPVTYLVRAQVWEHPSNQPLPPASTQINNVNLIPATAPDGSVWGVTFVTAPAGVNVDVTPTAPGNYTFDNMQVQELNLLAAVDLNRDGQITLNAEDTTTPANPYRFWINDSKESGDDESGGGADDQIPGRAATDINAIGTIIHANYFYDHIQGRSDLVNFFPVALCLSNILQWLPPTNGFEYRLIQDDSAVKFVYTSLTPTNAFDYLTNVTASTGYGTNGNEAVINTATIPVLSLAGTVLDTNWLTHIQTTGGNGVILVEGCAATTKPLWLEIWHKDQSGNNKLLGGTPLYLSISSVEKMYRRLNLCGYANGVVDTTPGASVGSQAYAPNEPTTKPRKNFVFLHGYNVNQQQSRGVQSEMFKRFYWSGSQAKFYGVTWNGAVSQIAAVSFTSNYHTNVVNALLTAPHLASFLGTLSGETTVAAHSLGNMVVLSAISDWGATPSHYFMIDAAVPIEAVQGNMTNDPTMIHSAWKQDATGQPYDQRLYAADWWRLFPADDKRSTLTWRNRLGNLGSVDIYNFYSSGEEVLRKSAGPIPNSVSGAIGLTIYDHYLTWFGGAGLPFGTYGFTWQEVGKGTFTSETFLGSRHGGWKFNDAAYGTNVNYSTELSPLYLHMSADAAAQLSDSQLQTSAFFSFASDLAFGIPAFTADDALLGPDGSTYAQVNRDRILSDAIPALTLPVGANKIPMLSPPSNPVERNFDLSSTAFQNGWPSARTSSNDPERYKWHHSDFDYVSYPFTYKLFNQIATSGNLK